jgi:hypothetical protein
MGKYNVISEGSVNLVYPDKWATAMEVYNDEMERFDKRQVRAEAQERYDEEQFKEQERYDEQQEISAADRIEEQKRYMAKQTNQKNILLRQNAIDRYNEDKAQYSLITETMDLYKRPELLQEINKKYDDPYLIPKVDGGHEEWKIVPQELTTITNTQVQTKQDFEDYLESWPTMTKAEKIAIYPKLKEMNTYFNKNLAGYEDSYNRALSHDDNESILDAMGSFLPATYSDEQWEEAKKVLLKDGKVSAGELQVIAADITRHISEKTNAREFWTKWSSDIMQARSKLGIDSPQTIMQDLHEMSQGALDKMETWYPGVSTMTLSGQFSARAREIAQLKYEKDYDNLNENQKIEVTNLVASGWTPESETVPYTEPEGEPKPMRWEAVKDPVTKTFSPPDGIGIRVKQSPFTYANKGLIPSDEWPGFKEVSIKEALQHYQKNKSKYKKDKKITVSQGLFRDRKDLTQYPDRVYMGR